MIDKPSIIITSLGRTGTLFITNLYREIFTEGTVLHEPDYFNFGQYRKAKSIMDMIGRQINEAGFKNIVLKKILGQWSVVDISHQRMLGRISRSQAAQRLINQRAEFIQSRKGLVYVESSSAWFGLMDVLGDVFPVHRGFYIIRNGIDWVRSKMNFGNIYNKGFFRSMISYSWPTALDFKNDLYHTRWTNMTRFERICWAWTRMNEYGIHCVSENPTARIVKFEDIFQSPDRLDHLMNFISYSVEIMEDRKVNYRDLVDLLDKKIHTSSGEFPTWKDWSDSQKAQFKDICGDLMEKFEYEYV